MKRTGQSVVNGQSQSTRPQSTQTYLRTLLCLLLVLFGSTVQAAHAHGKLLPVGKAQISSFTAGQAFLEEELCPLCAAMHSALPSPTVPVLHAAVVKTVTLAVAPRSLRRQHWSFELFSRPPPSLV